MKISEESKDYFEQNPDYVIEYLESRGVKNEAFNKFIKGFEFGLLEDASFCIGEERYDITHLLGKSKVPGYDIVAANRNLGLAEGDDVAIALVVGDDVICYNTTDNRVCLYLIQTGEGEKVIIDESLELFVTRLENKEDTK